MPSVFFQVFSAAALLGGATADHRVRVDRLPENSHFQKEFREYVAGLERGDIKLTSAASNRTNSPTFAASGTIQEKLPNTPVYINRQYVVYDEVKQVQVEHSHETLPFGKGSEYQVNVSTFLTATGGNVTINDRCQPLPNLDKFAPQFSWLKFAQSHGNVTINGRQCELLTLNSVLSDVATCLDDNNLPVQTNVTNSKYVAWYADGSKLMWTQFLLAVIRPLIQIHNHRKL